MKNNNIKIVIIDSGLDKNDEKLASRIKKKIYLNQNHNFMLTEKNIVNNKHGTLIAKTILTIYNNVDFIDICILNENLRCNINYLIKSLEYSLNYNPNIVHLSLGTTDIRYCISLKKTINKLNKKNIIVVAATDNSGKKCYPAYFNNVIGVRGQYFKNQSQFYYQNHFFYASDELPVCLKKDLKFNVKGSSISAAYITGHICNILDQDNNDNNDVKNIIIKLIYNKKCVQKGD